MYRGARSQLINNGTTRIELVHVQHDKIAATIASLLENTLRDFFMDVSEQERWTTQFVRSNITIHSIASDSRWRSHAEERAGRGVITLYIKGWNYKFDIQNLLEDTWVESGTKDDIKGLYNTLVSGSSRDATDKYADVASLFIERNVIIPIIGIQNYAVYVKGQFPSFKSEEFKDIEILMLPYYWRQR